MDVFWAAFGGGAAAGVVAIFIELFRLWVGRDRLEVTVSPVLNGGDLSLGITVRNSGRRPVYLVQVAIELKDKRTIPYTTLLMDAETMLSGGELPCELWPGAKVEYYFWQSEFHGDVVKGRGGNPPRVVVITDALDHKHSGRITPDRYEQWIRLAAEDGVAP